MLIQVKAWTYDKKEKGVLEMSEAKGSNKLIMILLIFTLLLVISAAGVFSYFVFFKDGNRNATAPKKSVTEKTFELNEFVTNLADEETTYIKMKIVLGYEDKKLDKELPNKVAAIRDTINSTLWSKTSIDFAGKGTENVKKELLISINSKLEKAKITNIYLNEIIIQ